MVTFDRVTYRCRSRLLKTWVDTALLYTFAYYAMERAGWRYSAIQNRWEILSLLREPVSISNVANVPSRRRYLHSLIAPVRYPDHYVEAAIALGAALLAIVDWESLAGLLLHDSIEAWIATLPGTARDCVNELLWPQVRPIDELTSTVPPEYFIRLATAFSFVKRDTAATQFFELAIQSVPESFENRLLLLKHLLRTEQVDLASRFAEEFERMLPDNLDLQAIRGEIALQTGDIALALEHLIRATSSDAAAPTALLKLGEALDRSGRIQDALGAFARAETTEDLFIASAARSWMEALEPGILKTRSSSGLGSGIQLA